MCSKLITVVPTDTEIFVALQCHYFVVQKETLCLIHTK